MNNPELPAKYCTAIHQQIRNTTTQKQTNICMYTRGELNIQSKWVSGTSMCSFWKRLSSDHYWWIVMLRLQTIQFFLMALWYKDSYNRFILESCSFYHCAKIVLSTLYPFNSSLRKQWEQELDVVGLHFSKARMTRIFFYNIKPEFAYREGNYIYKTCTIRT